MTLKLKFSNNQTLIQEFKATEVSGLQLRNPEDFGLSEIWYGGNLKHVGTVPKSPILLMVNRTMQTIAVAVELDKIDQLTKEECEMFGVAVPVKEELPFDESYEDKPTFVKPPVKKRPSRAKPKKA